MPGHSLAQPDQTVSAIAVLGNRWEHPACCLIEEDTPNYNGNGVRGRRKLDIYGSHNLLKFAFDHKSYC
jgi:hypothetical protein